MNKKIFGILIATILIITGFVSAEIEENINHKNLFEKLSIKEPIIKELGEFTDLSLSESNTNLINPGKPTLPKIVKTYIFPFGTKIDNVQVDLSDKINKILTKPLKPSPEIKMISTIYEDTVIMNNYYDYSDIDIYPENQYIYRKGSGLFNGEHVLFLTVNIYPIQYFPKQNMISYFNSATIDIHYQTSKNPISFVDEYDLLILTPAKFADELQPLVDYKNENDIPTIMTTLDDIPEKGVDQQEDIKYYIKDAIENMGITYLLLVGAGVENEELFPVRNAWILSGNYEEYFPSDLYYADIYDSGGNFSDWDLDDDGKYAEDKDTLDMYPDVYLGKLPCNSEEEVTLIVDKIINYEEHNKMLNNIVQIGGDTVPGDPNEVNEGEFANEKVLEKLPGYNSIRLWASKSNGALKLTKQNIANGFNNNADFIDFSGHGTSTKWLTYAHENEDERLPASTIISPSNGWHNTDFDLFLVSNKYKHPVVVFNACSCSKYSDSDKCISWKALNSASGGIASFGSSGVGYASSGEHVVERVWGWMEVHIFESLYNDKILGEVWANCLNGYINSFIEEWDNTDCKTICEMAMFGDPTLAIEDGKDPKSIRRNTNLFDFIEKLIQRFPIFEFLL